MIEVSGLTKRYGDKTAVNDLSFIVKPGIVVVDLGDRVVMRPISEHPVAALKGKYADRGPSADAARAQERRASQARERS